MKKQAISKSDSLPVSITNESNYMSLLSELKSILSSGQAKAYKAVDNIKVQTYWQLGERIVREEMKQKDRADYGKLLVKKLTADLSLSESLLYEIIKFFKAYPIFHTVCGELSWSHYGHLIKIEESGERKFYQDKAVIHSWGVRELKDQIESRVYEKLSFEKRKKASNIKLPATDKLLIFKGAYDLGFTGSQSNEKDLENNIINNIEAFLRELGNDFCFIGRQIPIKIDGLAHYIDIILYHKGIPCNILVDLKTGKLNSRDVGQMNKYVNYFRKNRQYDYEKDTIGLIICHEAGKEEVQYALGGLEEKIFIATYKSKLPTVQQLKKAVRNCDK